MLFGFVGPAGHVFFFGFVFIGIVFMDREKVRIVSFTDTDSVNLLAFCDMEDA
jgi:hypothetical protein